MWLAHGREGEKTEGGWHMGEREKTGGKVNGSKENEKKK